MIRTWHIEAAFVAAVLIVTALVSGGSLVEFVGASAVLLGFMHGQIADRLHERQGTTPSVECARLMWWYWCAKEVGWIVYFLAHESYAALAGAGVFILYPLWRRWWRSRYPLAIGARP